MSLAAVSFLILILASTLLSKCDYVTGWVIGAVALACFVMAAACFTVRKCASQEEQTWIQRRLSRDKPVSNKLGNERSRTDAA